MASSHAIRRCGQRCPTIGVSRLDHGLQSECFAFYCLGCLQEASGVSMFRRFVVWILIMGWRLTSIPTWPQEVRSISWFCESWMHYERIEEWKWGYFVVHWLYSLLRWSVFAMNWCLGYSLDEHFNPVVSIYNFWSKIKIFIIKLKVFEQQVPVFIFSGQILKLVRERRMKNIGTGFLISMPFEDRRFW